MSEELQQSKLEEKINIKEKEKDENEEDSPCIKLFSRVEILITLYTLDCIVHFIECIHPQQKIKIITKSLLMPLLLLIYLSITPKHLHCKFYSTGLIFGAIGDIILLCPDDSFLNSIGATFFALGHVCYMISFSKRMGMKEFKENILMSFIFLSFILVNFYFQYIHYLKGWLTGHIFHVPTVLYFLVICAINTFSSLLFFFKKSVSSFFICLGSLIFWYSDFVLVENMYSKKILYLARFRVMTTYVAAQTCIAFGMSRHA